MDAETIVDETFILEDWKIVRAYAGCLSWIYKIKGNNLQLTKKPFYMKSFQNPTRHNRIEQKTIEIFLEEKMNYVSVRIVLKKPKQIRLKSKTKNYVNWVDELEEFRKTNWPMMVKDLINYLNGLKIRYDGEVNVVSNIKNAFKFLFYHRPPLLTISDVIYEKPPPISKTKSILVVLFSVFLFLGFYVFYFWFDPMRLFSNVLYLFATYGIAILFLYWVYSNDRYEKEPRKLVMTAFCWGVFSGIIVDPLNRLLRPFFVVLGTDVLAAAFVEESIKAVGLYFLVSHKTFEKEFNSPLDGIVYGFAVGIGFFAMENFFYYLNYGFATLVIRSLVCWGHGVCVATTGLWLAIAKVIRGRQKLIDIFPGLLVAISLHFLWNGWDAWLILLFGEKYGIELAGDILYLQIFFQFYYLLKIIWEALRDEELWGYVAGSAPK